MTKDYASENMRQEACQHRSRWLSSSDTTGKRGKIILPRKG